MTNAMLGVGHAVIKENGPVPTPTYLRLIESEHSSHQDKAGPGGGGGARASSLLPTAGTELQRQMWCDSISFQQMAEALHAWLRSEPQVGVVAIDYCGGYRVGILTNQLTRDTMRALHRSFECMWSWFGGQQLAVYVFGSNERDADILTDDTSYVIRRSK